MKIRFESHLHTNYSDGINYKKMIDSAARKKINVVAVTDHNIITQEEIIKYAQKKGILVIPSEEIDTKKGEILAYNIKKTIPGGLNTQEAIRRVHKQGGLALAAHPHHIFPSLSFKVNIINSKLDGIELLNYYLPNYFYNKNKKILEQKRGLCYLGGSDAHYSHDVGLVINELNTKKEINAIINAIKNKQIKIVPRRMNRIVKYTRFLSFFSSYYPRVIARRIKKIFYPTHYEQ